jgi:hypothetical protein
MIKQLKELLEGSTIISIENLDKREAICRITTRKNNKEYSFSLYGNDLGSWISDHKDNNNVFLNFQDLLEEAFTHLNDIENFSEDIFICAENPMKRTLGFICQKCKKKFIVSLTVIKKSKYRKFFTTPKMRAKFAKVLSNEYIMSPEMVEESIKNLD